MVSASQKISQTYRGLGTVISLTIFGCKDKDKSLLDKTYELIRHYESLFTANRETSELLSISQAAGKEPVSLSPAVYSLVAQAVAVSQEHFGFNAAIGPLVKLWHIGFQDARVPTEAEIYEKLKLTSLDSIVLDADKQSVYLPVAGMELDLGAIAKGYIADRIKDFWLAYGIKSGIINLGGNILLLGAAPHQADGLYRIGIRNPLRATDETIAQILTKETSVVTSGISERQLEAHGKAYHHIIDPETGYPHDNEIASITVLTDQSIDGEIETTRLFFADKPLPDYPHKAIYIYRDRSMELVNLTEKEVLITNNTFYIKK